MSHHRRHHHRSSYRPLSAGYPGIGTEASGANGGGSIGEGVFMIIFGGIFFSVGAFVAWLMNSDVEGVVKENAAIGTGAGILFAVVGLAVIVCGIRSIVRYRKILTEGRRYRGKIWQHEPDPSFYVNNRPGVMLVVHYMGDDGQPKEVQVKTGSVNEGKFPLGATVEIAVTENGAILIPKSVSDTYLPEQEELLKPVIGMTLGAPQGTGATAGIGAAMAVACPGCGATVMMLPGSSVQCASCGRQFSLTADRMIV